MELSFSLDPETDQPHIYQHGVTEAEVRQILARPGLTLRGRGDSRIALGETETGRYLKVIYAPARNKPGIFVITSYALRGKELRAYRRRRRRRHQ